MQRWHASQMLEVGQKLFAKIYKRQRFARHNHDVHILAREINDWLPKSIQSMIDGTYTPRYLKRRYFPDEMIDQLHLSDRILQHILLKQLKPTIKHVTNQNCVHVHGPTGVKIATQQIREALQTQQYHYIIRADIKSFYKSIPHHKLIDDFKKIYDDSKLLHMLEEIIKNPIETPRGYKNTVTGIALRGPLSQFFSAIYLKPLDDAFDHSDVMYIRYQDDLICLCKTKRQLNRCRRKMMNILQERKLKLSRKKSRIGAISGGFHFLGIDYPATQPQDNINVTDECKTITLMHSDKVDLSLVSSGGGILNAHSVQSISIEPHMRTIRNAREKVKIMVTLGFSTRRIRNYLKNWARWWVKTTQQTWKYDELLLAFIKTCWHTTTATIACEIRQNYLFTLRCNETVFAA